MNVGSLKVRLLVREARTLKDSALWYRDVIAGNGLPPR